MQVLSCISGTPAYHEQKLMDLVKDIQVVEMIQNFQPIVPSPTLQDRFIKSVFESIYSVNFNLILELSDLVIDVMEEDISKQDLYIPYMAAINIWNNLIFGNLHSVESFLTHIYHVLHSRKFWKKFDSMALSLWNNTILRSLGKMTRSSSRWLLRYLGEKSNASNRTSHNHVNDMWENIYNDFDRIRVNTMVENMILPLLNNNTDHDLHHNTR